MHKSTHANSAPTPGNWQEPAHLRRSFQQMDQLFPHHPIGAGPARTVDLAETPEDLGGLAVQLPGGPASTAGEILAATDTDGWMVLHGDRVIAEEYFGGMAAPTRHLLMSVSKSIVSTIVGALAAEGRIDPAGPIIGYIPELAGSGYAGATVRDLLDMRSGIRFSEEYLDPDSEVRMLDVAAGWAPRREGVPATLKGFLSTLEQTRGHGGAFEYRSCETDVLGWACEAATGRPFAELASDLLWSRIGARHDAFILVDPEGTGLFDGGICATLGDLARFGSMIRDGGMSLTGERVLESAWVDDIFAGGPDSADAFAQGPHGQAAPGGQYRSQFWFLSGRRDVALCLGIHGQMVYINRSSGVVGVKLSTWPLPVDQAKGLAAVAMFDAISARMSLQPQGPVRSGGNH